VFRTELVFLTGILFIYYVPEGSILENTAGISQYHVWGKYVKVGTRKRKNSLKKTEESG
jgi:hypothetical protein